jgi:hypothetical protein
MKPLLLLCFASALLLSRAEAATPVLPKAPAAVLPAKKPAKSEWVFSILPKSLQKNPRVELTVITEMTELGKAQPVASPEKPVYYLAQSSGYRELGHAPHSKYLLQPEEVERLLAKALATNGFLPTSPGHPPTLVIFYTWGSHSMLVEGDAENPALSAVQVAANLLDRAALVGGAKFSQDMLKLFEQADAMAVAGNAPLPPGAAGPVMTPEAMAFANPIEMFKRADPKNEFLVEQFTNDLYYVVATAYDYGSIATKTKRLYWRTRMTVAAQGVTQDQTLPTLIASAAPFFGKEMTEPEILTKRAVREGQVEIGTATVVDTPPATPAETKARKP